MLLIVAASLLLGSAAEPPRDLFAPPVPEPLVIASESGEYVLTISARNEDFDGPAPMILTKNGQEVWAQEREFTLNGACVTNDGRVVGYAYDHGIDGFNDENPLDEGNLLVLVFGAEGSVLERHEYKRKSINITASPSPPPTPQVLTIIDAEDHGQVILRVSVRYGGSDRGRNGRFYDHEWWRFRLVDGSLVEKVTPAHLSREKPSSAIWGVVIEVVIPGTQFVFVHEYNQNLARGDSRSDGARLSIEDFHGNRIWLRDFADEYNGLEERWSVRDARPRLKAQVSLRNSAFSFTSLATGQTHWFAIEKTDDELGAVIVELPGPPSTDADEP